jgi:serine phosphatase RsbU (regulator of sigma subunit)
VSLRTKLVLAFLLLSVVPLAAITAYGYLSSTRALRQAAVEETTALAADLSSRMELVEARLGAQVRSLKGLPLEALVGPLGDQVGTALARSSEYRSVLEELAPFVDSLEFIPQAPPAPPTPPEAPFAPAAPVVIPLEEIAARVAKATELARQQAALAEAVGEAVRGADAAKLEVEVAGVERLAAKVAREAAQIERLALAGAEAAERSQRVGTHKLLRGSYECPVEAAGRAVGRLRARVEATHLLETVLAEARREEGEIPFAVDGEGNVYAASDEDWALLDELGLASGAIEAGERAGDWAVVKVGYADSDLAFGIARPLRDSLRELRRTSGRNFAFGLGLLGLALAGVVPLSRRITADLGELTRGAERLAAGELHVEVPVRSRDEVGRLAGTFNRMARDLRAHRERLVETELARRLLASENARKTAELEEARSFQLSLLPKALPEHPRLEVAVFMRTATEVGGDYYDFRSEEDGRLTVAIGDATGHGAKAGTMVTVIKSLFIAGAGGCDLPEFLAAAASSIRRMELGRMAMALAVARLDGDRLEVSSAGMPPVLVRRASGELEEIALQGLPLGGMAQPSYQRHEVALAADDIVLLMSDGLPELPNGEGEPFGYARLRRTVDECAGCSPQEIITRLAASADNWTGGRPPGDDVTFVVVKVR